MTEQFKFTGVGIKGLEYPVKVPLADGTIQTAIGLTNVFTTPPMGFTGPDIGIFIEILGKVGLSVDLECLSKITDEVKRAFSSSWSRIEVSFQMFVEKKTPTAGGITRSPYECLVRVDSRTIGVTRVVQVKVPVLTCYPFSNIDSGKVHNQRSIFTIQARLMEDLPFEELIGLVEAEASSPIYGHLTNADEAKVLDGILNRPQPALRVMQRVASRLEGDRRISWYALEVDNLGSIHNYNTYGFLEKDKWYLFPTAELIYER